MYNALQKHCNMGIWICIRIYTILAYSDVLNDRRSAIQNFVILHRLQKVYFSPVCKSDVFDLRLKDGDNILSLN